MALTRKEIARRRQLGVARGRVWHLIRYEMRKRGYHNLGLAKALGCSDSLVSEVLTGRKHSPLVLDGLRRIGIPEMYLHDPRGGAARVEEAV